ncbi:secreted PhoX family phosphatase [Novosphingobium chloroacetimidivorans]|uniref:Secreted PhoX family phosphatase n=1 Tax=Novosphingobium chloroacetimidivorans TaxID=1428314 RepID=A0A7W7KD07_9SPHN|nr:PhoX family phosphatase [Novosphingobium chloroacetimidivorans]MBB4859978.1 secreted PhoX family phosphatase [Novosphingobium chloroacetimidivorans]
MTDRYLITGYTDGDVDTNTSLVPSLESLAAERYSRRKTLMGGLGATGMAVFGTTMLSACGGSDDVDQSPVVTPGSVAATSAGRIVTLTTTTAADVLPGTWTQTSGPSVTLTTVDRTTATFIAPAVAAATDLVFTYNAPTQRGGTATASSTVRVNPAVLGFAAVPKNLNDVVTVPAGYTVTVMTRLGDPLASGVSAYANNGTDGDFDKRIGDHGDALHFFGLSSAGARDDNSNTRGLMVQNHENLNVQYLHPNGPTNVTSGARPQAEALKEMMAHGVSVAEYVDAGGRKWSYVPTSSFNRRITPATVMQFSGPAAGNAQLRTVYSPDGTRGRGTINNCANGFTPWATNLTAEENWAGYFRRDAGDIAPATSKRTAREITSLARFGVTSTSGSYRWSFVATTDTLYTRWNATATADSALQDFRNEPNQFGWVVEIDPYDPASTPRKRTALGRFGHEGAFVRAVSGKKVGVYMGDDARNEYLYKFVSNATYASADAGATNRLAMGDKYFDAGTLYVAKFNADGTGQWLPLVFGQVPARPASGSTPAYTFVDQADILINTRLAADALGATPMDRPEWTEGNPNTGEIYLTLTNTNAASRPLNRTDAANPRHYNDPKGSTAPVPDPATPPQPTNQFGNPNGHIIRIREAGDDTASLTFRWDIYLFGADSAQADANVNISGLTADNDFSSPDGLFFSRTSNAAGGVKPVLWIQTDDGAFTDRTNNQMLAALPGSVGDGGAKTITNRDSTGATATQATIAGAAASSATLRRFLVGPSQCEITGIDSTPDGRTLFVGIQHPGEDGTPSAPSSHWPDSQGNPAVGATVRPRSAVVAITKDDGGVIAL